METWEMIKELTKNPKLKFRNGIDSIVKISDKTKTVVWVDEDGDESPFILYSHAASVDNLHIVWELVPQEVTWQEAIQAWIDGKDFRIERDGITYEQANFCGLGWFEGRNNWLYPKLFKEGKWYIK